LDKKAKRRQIKEIINPNKNILGKIVLRNTLLPLLLNDAKTDGDTTTEKKIIDPAKKAIKILLTKIINSNYLFIR